MSVLYHFSDRGDIERFEPRPPSGHPESEPLVFAIDAWHSPLYYFPRDCPRTGAWPIASTTLADRGEFGARAGGARMLLSIQCEFEKAWREASLYRYSFAVDAGWIDAEDHGCWVSRQPQVPVAVELISDFPARLASIGCEVVVVEDLPAFTRELRACTWHVSAIRHRLLPGFRGPTGTPVKPP